MTKLEKIEQWERWDRQIEEDAASGKLDKLAEEALADIKAGRSTPLYPIPSR